MPIYVYECTNCGHVEEFLAKSHAEGMLVAYMQCTKCAGLCSKIPTTVHFRVTGFNAKNGYTSIPTYNEVIDENGHAKKKWGK